jgi:hypothetical protein
MIISFRQDHLVQGTTLIANPPKSPLEFARTSPRITDLAGTLAANVDAAAANAANAANVLRESLTCIPPERPRTPLQSVPKESSSVASSRQTSRPRTPMLNTSSAASRQSTGQFSLGPPGRVEGTSPKLAAVAASKLQPHQGNLKLSPKFGRLSLSPRGVPDGPAQSGNRVGLQSGMNKFVSDDRSNGTFGGRGGLTGLTLLKFGSVGSNNFNLRAASAGRVNSVVLQTQCHSGANGVANNGGVNGGENNGAVNKISSPQGTGVQDVWSDGHDDNTRMNNTRINSNKTGLNNIGSESCDMGKNAEKDAEEERRRERMRNLRRENVLGYNR